MYIVQFILCMYIVLLWFTHEFQSCLVVMRFLLGELNLLKYPEHHLLPILAQVVLRSDLRFLFFPPFPP